MKTEDDKTLSKTLSLLIYLGSSVEKVSNNQSNQKDHQKQSDN